MAHDKPWYQQKEFLKLRYKWYRKAKDSGFTDIEHIDWKTGESGNLLEGITTGQLWRKGVVLTREQQRYYELARQYPHNRRMPRLDRKVWLRHSKGMGSKDIARQCGCGIAKAQEIIRKHKQIMLEENSREDE